MNNTRHILVVDDETELLELVTSFLEKESYNVLTAQSGLEALQLMETYLIDLVVLDVMMEEMDGFAACEKIREVSQVPIIMLTARSGEEDKIKGLKIGADDYIVKPFIPRELLARVEAASISQLLFKLGKKQVDKKKGEIYRKKNRGKGRKLLS